jgi:hypothetical protein
MQQPHPYDLVSPWRLIVGIALLVLALVMPFLSVWVAFLPLSVAAKAVIVALLLLGAPEVCVVLAVFVMGKPTYNALKAMVMGWVAQRNSLPADRSSRRRGISAR